MNPSTTDLNDGGSDSHDCVNLIVDGPGDSTVRPPSPEFLKWAEAERERLAKYGFNLDGTRIEPANGSEAN